MSSEDKKVWGVHTQDDYLFLHKDVIAIGWKDFGDLKAIENTRDAFKEHYATVYPQSKNKQLLTAQACYIVLFTKFRPEIILFSRLRVIEKSILVLLRENTSMFPLRRNMCSSAK